VRHCFLTLFLTVYVLTNLPRSDGDDEEYVPCTDTVGRQATTAELAHLVISTLFLLCCYYVMLLFCYEFFFGKHLHTLIIKNVTVSNLHGRHQGWTLLHFRS
jgi:hypothetical protein